MIKQELISAIAKRTGTENHEAAKHLEATMHIIMDTIAKGEHIWLRGFGSFQYGIRQAKTVRIGPGLTQQATIPARAVPLFKPSEQFKLLVAGADPIEPTPVTTTTTA